MVDIDNLYYDEDFNSFLNAAISRNIAYFNPVSDRRDYKQDIFVEIMDSECETLEDCKRAAWRVLNKERKYLKDQPVSTLWEDNHNVEAI